MKVSVIIPTYNGSNKITNLLQSLEKQTFKEFEVIVIIDGSTDDTLSILNHAKYNFNNFLVVNQDNQGRGRARNNGAKVASNELLVFFDDDILPKENCIELHVANHLMYPKSVIVGACRMDINSNWQNDFTNYRYFIENKWQTPLKDKLTKISFDCYSFTSANMSVSREVFIKIGGFDDRLNDSEDFDFSIKVLLQKTPIYFDYIIWAWHCDYTDIGGYIKRQKEYLNSKSMLAKLKPDYVELIPSHFSRNKVFFVKRFFSRLFIYNSFWRLVVNTRLFLQIVPIRIRYALYSKIIFSSSLK